MLKRIVKILGILLLVVLLLVVVIVFALKQEKTQNRLAQEATTWLSDKLDTKVTIDKVKVDFLNRVHFKGLYIEDQKQDTLAYIGDFSANSTSIISDLWNDKTSVIKNVQLEGGVINLIRPKDSKDWNYSFIEKAFATEDDEDTTTSAPPKIDLKNLNVKDVRFAMLDQWLGQDLVTQVGELELKVNGFDIEALVFNINKVDIANTNVVFKEYKRGKPKNKKISSDHSSWGTAFNPENIAVRLNNLNLEDVNFEYQRNGHISVPGRFDERHIVAKNIQLDLEELNVVGDTVVADIVNLRTKERSGLNLKKFKAHVKLTQQLTELTDLYIETNHSIVRDYYRMEYANFHDFDEYINAVRMYARFKNSSIDKRDIAFFAGNISQLPTYAKLNGKAEGTVDNLFIPEIHAVGPEIDFKGKARITGLADVNNTFFDIEAERLLTTGREIIRIAPEANTEAIRWKSLSQVDFKGSFKGTTTRFNADGALVTNHGSTDVDMFMDLNGTKPSYDGYIHAKKLNLGKILGRKDIGIVSAKGSIQGQGFDFETVSANVNAEVGEIYFDGDRYENIKVNGDVRNKRFSGIAKSGDPNLGFDFKGNLDLSGERPVFDFKSDILKVNLKTLGLTEQDVMVKGKVNLDFEGENIDDFVGKAIMQDMILSYDNEVIRVPSLRLNSYYTDSSGKVLDLKSTVADARIVGRYSIQGIDKAVRSFMHYYLPTYIKRERLPENEIFDFDVLVRDANKIIQIYEPKLSIDSGTTIQGNINTLSQKLNLVGIVPEVTYDGFKLSQVGIKSNGNRSVLNSEIFAAQLFAGKSEIIKDATLNLGVSQDSIRFNLKTNPVDDFLGEANLDGIGVAFNDRIEVVVNPSTFIVKEDKYRLLAVQPIQYTKEGILYATDVFVQNGNQHFIFNSDFNGVTNDATVEIQNLDLEKITNYIDSKDLAFQGRVNSKVNITDIWGNADINGSLNTVDYLGINQDTLGAAVIDFNYNKGLNELTILESSKIEKEDAFLYTNGKVNFNENKLNFTANLNQTPISFAQQYVAGTIDSLRGEATGKVDVTGTFDNPTILGDLSLKNVGLSVVFTGCSYTMDDIELQMNKRAILFKPITIYDDRKVNQGSALVTGTITHSNYDKYRLRLNVSSDNILGLNTDQFNGELFYGYIPTTLDMDIRGPIDDIVMNIKAEPLEKGRFYMPLENGGDVGKYDFIKFKSLGRFQNQKVKKHANSYFKVNMDIKATPKVLATIILDPNTQEKIEARGSGNISLNVDLGNDEIEMYNTFTVKEGLYKFNFRGLLSRDFDLEEGGTITWSGDAYNAILDMKAVYKTKAALYSLISDKAEQLLANSPGDEVENEINRSKNLENTHVSIDLAGQLSKPDITFDITQPNNNDIGGIAQQELLKVKRNQEDVIYQAGMLLLFNSFKPSSGGLNTGNLAGNTTISTASDMISSAFSQGLTSGINKLGIPNITVNVGYKNYSADAATSGFGRRDQFNVGFQGSFFKDRFIVNFGNSVDVTDAGSNSTANNNFTYNGDFRGQYLLTLDGRYSLSAFRVSTFDYVENEPVTRGGVGLNYKRSFNKWNDLFKRKKRSSSSTIKEEFDGNAEEKTSSIKKEEPSFPTALQMISKISF